MLKFNDLFSALEETTYKKYLPALMEKTFSRLQLQGNRELKKWTATLDKLPINKINSYNLQQPCIEIGKELENINTKKELKNLLLELKPWRKGPFRLHGVKIDSEWQSNLKWNRLENKISPLAGRKVLDVGCGNGYYALRCHAAGAEFVLGIDPYLVFIFQFFAIKNYIPKIPVYMLPLSLEDMPKLAYFDTVFSMGLLYHRRSPFDHLTKLYSQLSAGGELILETFIIEGKNGDTLLPPDKYAGMSNIWLIPSLATLQSWLKKCKFKNITVLDVSTTDEQEQRSSEWSFEKSLIDFLNPHDRSKTIEGLPAPQRAILKAEK